MKMKMKLAPLLIILFLSLLIVTDFLGCVNAASTITDADVNNYGIAYFFQRKAFRVAGRYWVYHLGSDGGISCIKFQSSTDGESWSSATYVLDCQDQGYDNSVWFDGTYAHTAVRFLSGYDAWYSSLFSTGDICYQRVLPNSDGSVTSSANFTRAKTADSLQCPSISVDSNSYPWIGYSKLDSYAYVTKSSLTNGTWETDSGFPYQLSSSTDALWQVEIVPLSSGVMVALYADGGVIRVKAWNSSSSSWLSEVSTSSNSFYGWNAVGQSGNDVVDITLCTSGSTIRHVKYTYANNSLGSETTVQTSVVSAPVLSIDSNTNDLYCFWGNIVNNHLYYKKYNGTWETSAADWVDESTDTLTDTTNDLTCFYQVYDSKIGVIYETKASSPYKLRFASLTVSSTDTSYPTYSSVAVNSTQVSSSCEFSCLWQDNVGLAGHIFSTNNTGTWTNETWTSLSSNPSWANVTKTLNESVNVVSYRWYCNDTSNNWNNTAIQNMTTTSDTASPTYSTIAVSTSFAGYSCLFSCYLQDDTALSGHIFSTDNTGSWTNNTWASLSGPSSWANITKTLNTTIGLPISYRWYCNDTSNNWNSTSIQTLTTFNPPSILNPSSTHKAYSNTEVGGWTDACSGSGSELSGSDYTAIQTIGETAITISCQTYTYSGYHWTFNLTDANISPSAIINMTYLIGCYEEHSAQNGRIYYYTDSGWSYDQNFNNESPYANYTKTFASSITNYLDANNIFHFGVAIDSAGGANALYVTYVELSIVYANPLTIGTFEAPAIAYANKLFYINCTVNSPNGNASFVNATLQITESITVLWVNSTNTFSVYIDANNYCTLDSGLREAVNSTAFHLCWKIKLNWTYSEGSVNILSGTQVFDSATSGSNTESNLFTFTRKLIVNTASADSSRVDPSQSLTFTGQLYYDGTSTSPEDTAGISARVELNGVLKGSTITVNTTGYFTITFNAEATVNNYTYNVYSLTSETSVTNQSVAIKVDNLVISAKGVTVSRVNINSYQQYWFTLRSECDSSAVDSGSVTLNGTLSAVWIAARSRWECNTTKTSAQTQALYVVSASWNGVTSLSDQTLNTTSISWDSVTLTIAGPTSTTVSLGINASGIMVSGILDLDGTAYDGTITLNDTMFIYNTSGQRGYTVSSISGGSYPGVTAIRSVNPNSTYCIWEGIIWTLQAKDADGATLPRVINFSVTFSNGTVLPFESNSLAIVSIAPLDSDNYSVVCFWGNYLVSESITVNLTVDVTTTITTYIARLNSDSKYLLISINATDLPTPVLESAKDWKLTDISGIDSHAIKVDIANWVTTEEPAYFNIAGTQYNKDSAGWAFSDGIFTFTPVDFDATPSPTVRMHWTEITTGGSTGGVSSPPGGTPWQPPSTTPTTPTTPTSTEALESPTGLPFIGAVVIAGIIIAVGVVATGKKKVTLGGSRKTWSKTRAKSVRLKWETKKAKKTRWNQKNAWD